MLVKDLVLALLNTDQDLPVCLADWNERYRNPAEVGIVRFVEDKNCYLVGNQNEQRANYICLDVEEIQ